VIIHVCASDGTDVGQFEENDFRDNLFAGRFPADSFYWHEGMEDWRPAAEYRSLAKTQRISFTPPMVRTVKINVEPPPTDPPKPASSLTRLWRRLTGR
jgi:hypothetical protein